MATKIPPIRGIARRTLNLIVLPPGRKAATHGRERIVY
jgi:hypothetical protein